MNLNEIEKCPWCGNEIKSMHIIYRDVWYLFCRNCGYKTDKYPTWERARNQYETDKAIKLKMEVKADDE